MLVSQSVCYPYRVQIVSSEIITSSSKVEMNTNSGILFEEFHILSRCVITFWFHHPPLHNNRSFMHTIKAVNFYTKSQDSMDWESPGSGSKRCFYCPSMLFIVRLKICKQESIKRICLNHKGKKIHWWCETRSWNWKRKQRWQFRSPVHSFI